MKILINALGIQDSGGITVFDKVLEELVLNTQNRYILVYNDNANINLLFNKLNGFNYNSLLVELYQIQTT